MQNTVSPVFHGQLFLTRVKKESQAQELDTLKPDIQRFVNFGRPDLKATFDAMREQAKLHGERRVRWTPTQWAYNQNLALRWP